MDQYSAPIEFMSWMWFPMALTITEAENVDRDTTRTIRKMDFMVLLQVD